MPPYTIPSFQIVPGSVYQPKTSGPAYILDQIGGVIGCWSTRQLMAAGSGNIIRGRDSTTNEADYTSASYPSGIVTLANGGDAFSPAVYDQSGNGNHATQSTAANQPKLVDSGSLIVDASGRPVMEFNGSGSHLKIPDSDSIYSATALTVSIWAKNSSSSLASDEFVFSKYDFLNNNREWVLSVDSASNQVQIDLGGPTGLFAASWFSTSGVAIENYNLYTFVFSPSALSVYLNGSPLAGSVTAGSLPASLGNRSSDVSIGCRLTNGGAAVDHWDGVINDALIFGTSLTSDQVLQLYNGTKP